MSETRHFKAPFLAAGQAQKHVTVNEALARIDALAAPKALSRMRSDPPPAPQDGDLYIVGAAASGAWNGAEGAFALYDNGGWRLVAPSAGTEAWVLDEGVRLAHDGAGWTEAQGAWALGAGCRFGVSVADHLVAAGAASTTAPLIPAKSVVFGVTARVLAPLSGAGLTSWRLGVPDGPGRYGAGYGIELNAYADGLTSGPLTYYEATPLMLEAEGGDFASGTIRLAVHHLVLVPPRAV
ncbi:MAG: DUF2793 domain-containing protein [Rubrimonas sp.]|uniref:DUF2793 domain-containing protein n=1 Tax=Rubrimonas sp. TaxID=2036015 RepID=UPI002FDC8116